MIFEDWLCPCRTPLRDCHPPSWRWAKTLPEFLLRFLEIVSSFTRRAVLCREQAGPVPTEQWRSRLWQQAPAACGYSTQRKAVNFTQVRACTSVTVLSTRWHRGSLHSFLTGAQLPKTCVNQNWSRNQLHLLTCWTLVKPPHCSACIFLLQLWVQSVEEQIQETEPKPAFAIASKASAVHLFWLQKVSESVLFWTTPRKSQLAIKSSNFEQPCV